MKKAYITPSITIVRLELEGRLLDGSLKISEDTAGVSSGGFVKGQSSSTSHYNVWDDDWSE